MSAPTVFIVDDDEAVRDSIAELVSSDRAERLLAERVARRPERYWKTRSVTGTAAAS